jgi:hypothetical protein
MQLLLMQALIQPSCRFTFKNGKTCRLVTFTCLLLEARRIEGFFVWLHHFLLQKKLLKSVECLVVYGAGVTEKDRIRYGTVKLVLPMQ